MHEAIQTILVSVVAGVLAYAINVKLKKGGVFGSALVVLTSGVLYMFYLKDHFPNVIATFPVVATTASYAGMVAEKYIKTIWGMVITGLVTGILFYAGLSAFGAGTDAPFMGVGGTLGVIAAISCFVFISMKKFTKFLINKSSQNKEISK